MEAVRQRLLFEIYTLQQYHLGNLAQQPEEAAKFGIHVVWTGYEWTMEPVEGSALMVNWPAMPMSATANPMVASFLMPAASPTPTMGAPLLPAPIPIRVDGLMMPAAPMPMAAPIAVRIDAPIPVRIDAPVAATSAVPPPKPMAVVATTLAVVESADDVAAEQPQTPMAALIASPPPPAPPVTVVTVEPADDHPTPEARAPSPVPDEPTPTEVDTSSPAKRTREISGDSAYSSSSAQEGRPKRAAALRVPQFVAKVENISSQRRSKRLAARKEPTKAQIDKWLLQQMKFSPSTWDFTRLDASPMLNCEDKRRFGARFKPKATVKRGNYLLLPNGSTKSIDATTVEYFESPLCQELWPIEPEN